MYSHIKVTSKRVILAVIRLTAPRPAGPPQTVPPRRGWMMLNVESGIFPSSASLRRGLRGCVKLPPPRRLAAPAWQARRAAATVAKSRGGFDESTPTQGSSTAPPCGELCDPPPSPLRGGIPARRFTSPLPTYRPAYPTNCLPLFLPI